MKYYFVSYSWAKENGSWGFGDRYVWVKDHPFNTKYLSDFLKKGRFYSEVVILNRTEVSKEEYEENL